MCLWDCSGVQCQRQVLAIQLQYQTMHLKKYYHKFYYVYVNHASNASFYRTGSLSFSSLILNLSIVAGRGKDLSHSLC